MTHSLDFTRIRGVLLDMDGVVYVGDSPIPRVQDFLDHLEATGRPWLCVTNNASKTNDQFVDKLARMGVRATVEQVLSSAEAAAAWLAKRAPAGSQVLMIGMDGLRAALEHHDFALVNEPAEAEYVVVGAKFDLVYEDLARATLAIRNGAKFIGTNPDPSFPSERGLVPGTGSILALLAAASSVEPTIIGKPNAGMFEQAMQRLGTEPGQTLMVGDRYDTDIAGAIELGMPTVGVLTGVTTREGYAEQDAPPDVVVKDVGALLGLFEQADGS